MELESKIQSKITGYLTENGFYNNKILAASRSGFPDLLTIKNGITYYFEVKNETGKLSALQSVVIDRINKDKQIAFVVRSLDEFIKIWEEL